MLAIQDYNVHNRCAFKLFNRHCDEYMHALKNFKWKITKPCTVKSFVQVPLYTLLFVKVIVGHNEIMANLIIQGSFVGNDFKGILASTRPASQTM